MAKQLKISSLSISDGLKSGNFTSVFRGQGIEFESVREYETGDDVRSIDWNLTARSGKIFIKLYREERDLTIFLCTDFSLSMDFGDYGISSKEKTLETAALLAFAGINISSQIGAFFFTGEKGPIFMPRGNPDHVSAILKSMEDFAFNKQKYTKKGTGLETALTVASKILRHRSMIFIISDFKVEGFEKKLGLLAAKHDVICIRIINEQDKELPQAGSIHFKDMETDFGMIIPTGSKSFRLEYKKNFYEELERWLGICKRCLAHPVLLNVSDNTVKVLSNFFISKQGYQKKSKNNIRADLWKVF